MNKKVNDFDRLHMQDYRKPVMWVVMLQNQACLLTGSGDITNINGGDTGIGYGGGGSLPALSPFFDDWDE
ncbi:MAG: hypothetical protein J6V87_03620 [Prevotella sp.]|nr:hypothetical protein [Prevotella sp.]